MTCRKILVCITGLTPQVITETLYALLEKNDLPSQVILITTERGKNLAVRDLLSPIDGKFLQFCKDFNLFGKISLEASSIHIISDASGRHLDDIRTPEDNCTAANFIMQQIQKLCLDPETSLHLSIAGGRKSMGFLAGYALSIFGRDQDCLSHVLVSEPFESNRDFYYPTPYDSVIYNKEGKALNAREAEISLADIPFVRLRSGLTEDVLNNLTSFDEVIRITQQEIAPEANVLIRLATKELICGGKNIVLPPTRLLCYYWLAKRQKAGLPPVRPETEADLEGFFKVLQLFYTGLEEEFRHFKRTHKEPEDLLKFLQENTSRVNGAIKKQLGMRAPPFLIQSVKIKRKTHYFLSNQIHSIEIE